jgi:Domain of unknown function (DUF222)
LAAAAPESVREALDMIMAGFAWLAGADVVLVPAVVQAECLRELERVRSVQTAAQARVLGAFDAGQGYEDDGCRSARTWLMWQTQVTPGAASAAVGWMRRLRAHPAVAAALRGKAISESWARQVCDWTDSLPGTARGDADVILLGAAGGGAGLDDLARLAEQIRATLARPDDDRPPGFDDRQVRLGTTLGGAGKLDGDLSPQCAAAVRAVLDALGKKKGPEDARTAGQRRHDALAEACRRLIASGCVPDRAGQPAQIQLHLTLEDLLRRMRQGSPAQPGQDGPSWEQRMWPRLGTTAVPEPAPAWPVAAPGQECDAAIVPVVTGCLDHDLLDTLTAALTGPGRPGDLTPDGTARVTLNAQSVRDLIIASAAALFTGPRGLASWLRRAALDGPAATISLPLDTGAATDTIPAHLRRAVILRDRHCAAPGCTEPPAGCQVHHIRPRRLGGRTKLTNLLLLCSFHHLILVHTWGWTITLNPDGTTTMTSPDGKRTYHSHSPPTPTAA